MFPQEFSWDLTHILAVIAVASSPISELRGAIPLAIIGFQFPWYYALPISLIGNILPVPIILLFLNSIAGLMNKVAFFERMLSWLFERTRRTGKIIERYERIGLALFVAVPLPITGAWTGSIAAVLLGLRFKHAIISISIGVLIAGVIVTGATLLGWGAFKLVTN